MATTLRRIEQISEPVLQLTRAMTDFEKKREDAMKVERIPHGLITPKREEMWYAFKAGGWLAICQWMDEYGRRQSRSGDTAYKYFDDDLQRTNQLLPFILSEIYHTVIEALILGTLPQLELKDVDAWSTTKNMRTEVGIYINCFGYTGYTDRPNDQRSSPGLYAEDERGKGFSVDDYESLRKITKQYIDRNDVAYRIDSNPGPKKTVQLGDPKRFAHNASQIDRINEWRSFIKKNIIDSPPYTDKSKKLDLCPNYVGYGKWAGLRVLEHLENLSTSALWGLMNGLLRDYHKEKWKAYQNFLLPICGREYANLAEASSSILAGSYHDEGGLNPTRAGATPSMTKPADIQAYEESCGRNIEHLLKTGGRSSNPPGGSLLVRSAKREVERVTRVLEDYVDNLRDPIMDLMEQTQRDAEDLEDQWEDLQIIEENLSTLLMKDRLSQLIDAFENGTEIESNEPEEKNDLLKKYVANKQDPQKKESLELKAETKKNADALLEKWTDLQKTEEYLRRLLLRDRLAELMGKFKAGKDGGEIQVPRTP
ncbi:uncharacterized protein AB675_3574 [Cyphellophora attinorum]|uniref:Uncharacterized protein n=1 Tax=Cyphellophora attinorum TaxID=1664694 RepID=A0A0N1H8G2_9EURO|nr:uncharacterized protein AB675_3574 [Phialophora attinorum]KPI39624.1 hypothetical protein AB675_3574 [Phialophora attinorum]